MGDLGRYLIGVFGVASIIVGLIGGISILMGRPHPRPAAEALETLAWLGVITAVGAMLVLAASRM